MTFKAAMNETKANFLKIERIYLFCMLVEAKFDFDGKKTLFHEKLLAKLEKRSFIYLLFCFFRSIRYFKSDSFKNLNFFKEVVR